jgi:N-acetyl-gamma-glutamyl-phosphate reductase
MKTAVIGASGYAGGELLRFLAVHPHFQVTAISAHSSAGELVTSVHPHLTIHSGEKFLAVSEINFSDIDLVFIALPHGESASLIKRIPATVKIVDLGADYRLEDAQQWEKYYGGAHAGAWVYGLPELSESQRRAIGNESRVANPGCYATAITLGIAPAVNHVDVSDVVVVAASGTTGAGRSAKINLIASEVMGSLTSYKFGGVHQHTPEIEQAVFAIAQQKVKISFTPILAPMPRGILATVTAKLIKAMNTQEANDLFAKHYANQYFVDVLPVGQMPKTGSVTGSNKVQIQAAVDEHTQRLVVSVALDNLGKGAASQAIQNANIISGYAEETGLEAIGIGS